MTKSSSPSGVPDRQLKLAEDMKAAFGSKLLSEGTHAWKAFGLTFVVERDAFKEVCRELKSNQKFSFDMLIDVTCVDWLDSREPRFDVVYQLLSIPHTLRVCLKVGVSEDQCSVDSVRDLWASANFMEREAWDMYGVEFTGHGDLRRILMYEEFVGYPLRKDYPLKGKQPRIELRIPELRNDSGDMKRADLVQLPSRSGGAA